MDTWMQAVLKRLKMKLGVGSASVSVYDYAKPEPLKK
jgi:hypothetical protein